ncbi:universal stress protein [Saccharopolyspora sp. ASAGF58]|uniref:universal stress protein n=1 Tax=Saccharopolyspora sp. ASAGF58 TaxID=2719023 RepID=UPI0035300086
MGMRGCSRVMGMSKPVVVGFDFSESSLRAVRWAAREAASRCRPLLARQTRCDVARSRR